MRPKDKVGEGMSRTVKKVKDAVRCYLLKDLILHNRCSRGISLYYLTSTGSFAFQPTICTLSRSPAIPLLFLQATLGQDAITLVYKS